MAATEATNVQPWHTAPVIYEERFRTVLYSDRVGYKGAWNKIAVVTHEDDDERF